MVAIKVSDEGVGFEKPLVHGRGVVLGRDKRHASAVQKPLNTTGEQPTKPLRVPLGSLSLSPLVSHISPVSTEFKLGVML